MCCPQWRSSACTSNAAQYSTFIKPLLRRRYQPFQASTTSMHIVWTPFSSLALSCNCTSGWQPPRTGRAGDAVDLADEDLSPTDGEDTSDDADSEDLKWCPPNSNDPMEEELVVCRKLDTIMAMVQPLSTSSQLRTWCAAGLVAPGQTD